MNGTRQLPGSLHLASTTTSKGASEDSSPYHESGPLSSKTTGNHQSKKENSYSGSGLYTRPLDYCALISGESHSTELERTAKDLAQWLTLVEAGFNGLLDNSITEESDFDSGDSLGHDNKLARASDISP